MRLVRGNVKRLMPVVRWLAMWGCAGILGIAVTSLYHAIRSAQERNAIAPPGKIVALEQFRLHLNCIGSGSPTVLLESGAGASSNIWALVQRTVAQHTRACSYDRAGFGWSDGPPQNSGYDRVGALRALLSTAGERRPFVLAGHSLGGEYGRMYAYEHAEEVAGLVLIATSHPDVRRRDPALAGVAPGPNPVERVMPVLAATGLFRFWPEYFLPGMYRDYLNTLRKLPIGYAQAELAFVRHTRYHRAVLGEMESLVEMQRRSDAARHFGDKPLMVISERWVPNPADPVEVASARVGEELQKELAGFSRTGRRIVLDGGHVLPISRSKEVSEAILDVVAEVRRSNPSAGPLR